MSYGTNGPQGLVPFRYANGAPYTGSQNAYPITSGYATGLYTGDPVTSLSDGTIGIGVAGAAIRGIFMGVQWTDPDGTIKFRPYWPASQSVLSGSAITAFVDDDPNLIVNIQETNGSGAAGTPFALGDVGNNANFYAGAGGSTATGLSSFSLNNAAFDTTATRNLKIIALTPVVGNVVGAFANWICTINNHQFKGGTGTVGT